MSRRSHTAEIGCIACDELEDIGAGEKEGWLSDPTLLTAIHALAYALASYARSLVLVIGWDFSSPLLKPIKIRPSLSTSSKITALERLSSAISLPWPSVPLLRGGRSDPQAELAPTMVL